MTKPAPKPTPLTKPYWDGCAEGELRLQRCTPCARHYFYPRSRCPRCGSDDVAWTTVSGRGRLYSYVISHVPMPGFEAETPYAIAIVELAEGPRLMSNIVGIHSTPEHLELDMPLQVTFQQRDKMTVPVFEPAVTA